MSLYLWHSAYQGGFCVITEPQGIDDSYELSDGVSRQRVSLRRGLRNVPQFPQGLPGLADNLYGSVCVVVSKRLREALEKERVNNVEFLPIKIVNHKGAPPRRTISS